jgi:aspartokinase-like uncharacterized kinase
MRSGEICDRSDRPVVVYKIGGSLFDWPELFSRLKELLAGEIARPVVVSGGGRMADVVREWDRVHGLGDEESHRLAIASMSLGSRFLADGLDGELIENRDEAAAVWSSNRIAVLDAFSFLASETKAGGEPLPASWNVTSDSIAAWIASRWPASLVVIKSTFPSADSAYVDSYFSTASATLNGVEWVDLRSNRRGQFPCSRTKGSPTSAKVQHVV